MTAGLSTCLLSFSRPVVKSYTCCFALRCGGGEIGMQRVGSRCARIPSAAQGVRDRRGRLVSRCSDQNTVVQPCPTRTLFLRLSVHACARWGLSLPNLPPLLFLSGLWTPAVLPFLVSSIRNRMARPLLTLSTSPSNQPSLYLFGNQKPDYVRCRICRDFADADIFFWCK